MASSMLEMSLDEIIKTNRNGSKSDYKTNKKSGTKNVGIKKGNKKLIKGGPRGVNNKKGTKHSNNNFATKRLIQKLVNEAIAKKVGNGPKRGGVSKKIIKTIRQPFEGVNQHSKAIRKNKRSETVIVREIVEQPRPRPQQRQVIKEVVVQEPARRLQYISKPRFNTNRTKVVYVEQRSRGNGTAFQRRRFNDRKNQTSNAFYEPRNYLQRF